jgi:hypothetical protein
MQAYDADLTGIKKELLDKQKVVDRSLKDTLNQKVNEVWDKCQADLKLYTDFITKCALILK